jgi:hypothetical protein
VYEAAGVGPEDVDVVELHDCFAQNELIAYEALGLAAEGEGEKLVDDGDNTYGGKFVTNPIGRAAVEGSSARATGLAQCFELTQQLRWHRGASARSTARGWLQHNSDWRRVRRHAIPGGMTARCRHTCQSAERSLRTRPEVEADVCAFREGDRRDAAEYVDEAAARGGPSVASRATDLRSVPLPRRDGPLRVAP